MMSSQVDDRTARTPVDDVVDDVADLLSAGASAEEACIRLGRNAHQLSRRLYRAGRPDLARPFAALSSRIYYSRGTKR